jgi:hypothetical protein
MNNEIVLDSISEVVDKLFWERITLWVATPPKLN